MGRKKEDGKGNKPTTESIGMGYTSTPITCPQCHLPYWATGTSTQVCNCNTYTTWNTTSYSNQQIMDELRKLNEQYGKVWRKLNELVAEIEAKNTERLIREIKGAIKDGEGEK